jgi:hypothetical protein
LKHWLTASIKNACINIRIHDSAFAGIHDRSAQDVAASALWTCDVVAGISKRLTWLCAWIIGIAGS